MLGLRIIFILFQHLLVGLTEDIDSFVEMLELMLPQYFKGANELFHSADKDLNHVRKTKHKDPVSIFDLQTLSNTRRNVKITKLLLFTFCISRFQIFQLVAWKAARFGKWKMNSTSLLKLNLRRPNLRLYLQITDFHYNTFIMTKFDQSPDLEQWIV